mgnify:CR=1 FL=1
MNKHREYKSKHSQRHVQIKSDGHSEKAPIQAASEIKSEHLEEFFSELRAGTSPGCKPEHKQWQEYHYRLLNTLGYLNVTTAEAGMLERTKDAIKTTQETTKKVVRSTLETVHTAGVAAIDKVYAIPQFLSQCVFGANAQTGLALQQAMSEDTKQDQDRYYREEIIENPDFYLFLLASPVIEKSIRQGGSGFLAEMILSVHDYFRGKAYSDWGKINSISDKIESLHTALLPGVSTRPALYKEIIQQIAKFIATRCEMTYPEKKQLAEDIATLVRQCIDRKEVYSQGDKVGFILEFAKKYNIIDIIIENRSEISKLACDIWAKNATSTESIGFDEKAVIAMTPVIELVLKEGLSGHSFKDAKQFVETLVNMISMDHADPNIPVLVDLTRDIFSLASNNATIRKKLSSDNQKELTPESLGLQEFFRGYFVNLFKHRGLCMRLQNELQILNEQKDEAVQILSGKKGQQAKIYDIKRTIYIAKSRLQQALSNLQDFELQLQAIDKGTLMEHVERWNHQREQMRINNRENDPEARFKLNQLYEKKHQFALKHHLLEHENTYDHLIFNQADLAAQKAKIRDEIDRTDFNAAFFKAEDLIRQSREEVDRALKHHDFSYLSYMSLEDFSPQFQKVITKSAKQYHLDQQDLNGIIHNPEVQKYMRAFKKKTHLKAGKVSKLAKHKINPHEQKAAKLILSRIEQSNNWCVRILIRLLCGVHLPRCLHSGYMGILARSIKIYISLFPDDQSDGMRIMKSLEMIIRFNPIFWRDLMAEKGKDIRDLVNYTIADGHGDYVFTRPKHIEQSIKNIFEYVIHDAIRDEHTYEPVNLLLSVWTDPESFDRRHQELKQKYKMHQHQKGRDAGKSIAKAISQYGPKLRPSSPRHTPKRH